MRCTLDDRTIFPDNSEVSFRIDNAKVECNDKAEWMAVKLEVSDGNGNRNIVFDNVFGRNMGEVLAAIGKPPVDKEFDVEPEDLIGESGQCRVKIDNYQGKERNKVAAWLPGRRKPKLNELGEPDDIPF
jgi:hypothetical protein